MQVARLQITTTPIKMAYQTQNAQVNIKNPKGATLDMQTKHAKVKMQSNQPKVLIDQSACFSESGLKSNGELIADNAAYAYSKSLEAIGKIVDQGNQMADVHKGNPIPDQAVSNAYEQFYREWNMVTMPRSRPKIDVIEGKVNIDVERGKVINNTTYQPPQISATPGKVNIYVERYNSIDIQFINSYV